MFLPSKSEWAAFGASFNITIDDYLNKKFNLSKQYWTSTQYDKYCAYVMHFGTEYLYNEDVVDSFYVRLATTF